MTDIIPPLATLPADLPEECVARLCQLLDAVLEANRQFNLTAVRDPGEAWHKHILDSLQGLRTGLFEGPCRVIDVGTGAGFPGLPLALARPALKLTLLEATRKKCDFLAATTARLGVDCGLAATVLGERAETAGQDAAHRANYDVATARAVGSLSEVCELALPLVRVGGHAVLWRGEQAPVEVAAARPAIETLGGAAGEVPLPVLAYRLAGHERTYHLVVIAKVAATPPQFPRRVGLPKQRPL